MSHNEDLYGDLYGADDPELAGTPRKDDSLSLPEETSSSSAVYKDTTTTTTEKTNPPSSVPATTSAGASTSSSSSIKKPEAIPTYETVSTTPVGSAIPTYNSSDNSSYSYQPTQQNSGASGAGGDGSGRFDSRTVRPSEMRDEGKMFVGGLNWDTTDESLRNYFSEFGKIDACTIMRDAAGRSRGFAFLTFEDPAAVNAVMVREHFLDGKIIDPKRAIPRQEHHKTQKLFVGGLPPSVTTESMREFFMQYGKVVDATVMVDRDSSRSKGFGFVTFEDATGVEKLLALGNLEIDGKMIEVKLAQPRGARREDNNNTFTPNGRSDNTAMAQTGGNFNTPFDPQAMANLYQRMFQLAQGGNSSQGWNQGPGMMSASMGNMPAMNPMMMNPMMGAAGMGRGMMNMGMGGMMPGMGGGMGGAMGAGGMGAGGMGGGRGQNMGMGMGGGGGNIPGGPRAMMRGGQQQIPGQQASSGGGPTRFTTKGQHSFRPY